MSTARSPRALAQVGRRVRQRGAALITALFIIALATIAAVSMAANQAILFKRTETLLHSDQAWWVARGVADWVAILLERDRAENEIDHLGEFWAQPVDYLPVDQGVVTGEVVDLTGRFNLNNLGQTGDEGERQAQIFQRLLDGLRLDGSFIDAQAVTQAVRDWIDADIDPRFPGGAEDSLYSGKTRPYRAANQPFASVTELRLVEGVTPELYAALSPLVSALPQVTPININTAPPQVLIALADNPSPSDIQAFVESRIDQPAETVADVIGNATLGPGVDAVGLAVQSSYFLARGEATIGTGRVRLYSLIYRDAQGDARVLSQSRDAF